MLWIVVLIIITVVLLSLLALAAVIRNKHIKNNEDLVKLKQKLNSTVFKRDMEAQIKFNKYYDFYKLRHKFIKSESEANLKKVANFK